MMTLVCSVLIPRASLPSGERVSYSTKAEKHNVIISSLSICFVFEKEKMKYDISIAVNDEDCNRLLALHYC